LPHQRHQRLFVVHREPSFRVDGCQADGECRIVPGTGLFSQRIRGTGRENCKV